VSTGFKPFGASTLTVTGKVISPDTEANIAQSLSTRLRRTIFGRALLHRSDFTMGQFGENLTVEGLPDDEVRIGDRFRIGSAVFEVTQPRVTCYRVGIRMNDSQMPARLVAEGRPGFYLRVLEEGKVQAGDAIELMHRDCDSVTVAEVDALLYRPHADRTKVRQALGVPALSSVGACRCKRFWISRLTQREMPALLWRTFHRTPGPVFGLLESARCHTSRPRSCPSPWRQRTAASAQPGQFIVLKAQVSPASPPIMRSYSLAGTLSPRRYELGVKCERNGSMGGYLSERAGVGDPVEISAPRGSFVLSNTERPAVFMSAGIGITPVLAMLKTLAAGRSRRSVSWLCGARNGAEHPFAGEVRTLLSGLSNARSHFRHSRPADTDRLGRDFDSIGHVDAALVGLLDIAKSSEFYLCGPAAFLADVKTGLAAAGFPAAHVYSEVFGSGSALNPGIVNAGPSAPHEPLGARGTGPIVSFARSGLNVPWNARYPSLLEFAEACDVPTRWSCRTGVCHTCETGLVSGEVNYEPVPLQPPATGNLLVCCSVPKGEVVLDL
jgi:ferredoxin-NADP reductase/ferredoxin